MEHVQGGVFVFLTGCSVHWSLVGLFKTVIFNLWMSLSSLFGVTIIVLKFDAFFGSSDRACAWHKVRFAFPFKERIPVDGSY